MENVHFVFDFFVVILLEFYKNFSQVLTLHQIDDSMMALG